MSKCNNKYRVLYGIPIFILKIVGIKNKLCKESKISKKLEEINLGCYNDECCYFYYIKKILVCISVIVITCVLGILYDITGVDKGKNHIAQLVRNDYSEGDVSNKLIIKGKNLEEREITINIKEKLLSNEEILSFFSDNYNDIIKSFLNKNTNLFCIKSNLNLINQYNGIDITWNIEDNQYIDINGNLNIDNITKYFNVENSIDTLDLKIFMCLCMNNYSEEYPISLKISKEYINEIDYGQIIENKINSSENLSKKVVDLPSEIDNKSVEFYTYVKDKSYIFLVLGVMSCILLYYFYDKKLDKIVKNRRKQLEEDYSNIVNKLALLESCGMTILNAWDKIIEDYKSKKSETGCVRFAYEEMIICRTKISSGLSENKAYLVFGKKCGIHSYIKFSNLLDQNIKKGTKGLRDMLNLEVIDALENRKAIARKRGEEAATKMLLPMVILLTMSIAIIIVPVFTSLSI